MAKAILLNGASSAGKTTTALALQDLLDEPYLRVGIDLLIRNMLPKKFFLRTMYQENPDFYWKETFDPTKQKVMRLFMGERAMKSWQGLVNMTVGLLDSGLNVIIDEVAFMGAWQIEKWQKKLTHFDLLTVGVKCNLDELVKREKKRANRMQNSSRGQYFTVHHGVNYDLTVNTDQHNPNEIAQQIKQVILSKQSMEYHKLN